MHKQFRSELYNWDYDTITGNFARWGKTFEEDAMYSPVGPEILDIEVSTICNGIHGTPCPWCYKSNNAIGKNMSLETFKAILHKINEKGNLTQIAFGIGDIDANPDLYAMMQYTREQDIIPNITINGARLTDEWVDLLTGMCGAISVSHYDDDVCFNAVERLTNKGHKQINIHKLMSLETLLNKSCLNVLDSVIQDPRLKNLNALVFMTLKPVGKHNTWNIPIINDEYKELVNKALTNSISMGFDSCGSGIFLQYLKHYDDINYHRLYPFIEPCESSLFSSYVNIDGLYYPCSFTEQVPNVIGLDVLNCNSFIDDVWNNELTIKFRNILTKCRDCPMFKLSDANHDSI